LSELEAWVSTFVLDKQDFHTALILMG